DADDPIQIRGNPLQEKLVGEVRPALLLLLGAAVFVLLIACVNVINLFLVKALARESEIALRSALGGTRGRLIQMLFSESMVISVGGGIFGLILAFWGLSGIKYLLPRTVPRGESIAIDGWVICFTLG